MNPATDVIAPEISPVNGYDRVADYDRLARLYELQTEIAQRLAKLQRISNAALEGATPDDCCGAILDALREIFVTDIAAVLLLAPDGTTLRRRASVGLAQVHDDGIPLGVGAAGRIAAADSALVFDDVRELADLGPTIRASGVRSLLGAPLRARDRVTGVVYVASKEPRSFTPDEADLLVLVANRIAAILEHAVLYERALAAIRSRDAVLGFVSHDLRNPLGTIRTWMELFGSIENPQIARGVAAIQSAIDLMGRLIGDLLDLGSIDAGHLSIVKRAEDADALVREAVDRARHAAHAKSIDIAVQMPAQPLIVACDRDRVLQVLANLLSNATKFTPPGGQITIAASPIAGKAHVTVADTGRGIPATDLAHVFDRYWQAPETAHHGTGLGLAIARGIVQAHGGAIWVHSQLGLGATFAFTLPLAADPDQAPTAHHEHQARKHQAITEPIGPRVLLVDDERSALSALGELLAQEGFVVQLAADGQSALSKVRTFAPDIVIVDVELPGLSGPNLVRRIREDHVGLPAIVMTGLDEQSVAADLANLRASYVGKPVEIDALLATIRRELAMRHRA